MKRMKRLRLPFLITLGLILALTGVLLGPTGALAAAPTVISVNSSQGIQGQTENVTIAGNYFSGATAVDFGSGITVNSFAVTPYGGAAQVQVGTGTGTTNYPFRTFWMDSRTQTILLAGEIGQPGVIQALRLYCSTRPGQNLSYFYIRMQHTAMSSFSSSSYINSGWTTVLTATNVNVATWTVPGWVEFQLTTPFDYNGVSNLLVDYCVDNSYYTSDGYCRITSTAAYRTITNYHDLSSGNMLNELSGTLQSWYNNAVLVLQNQDTIDANITIDGAATPGYRDVSVTTPEGTGTKVNGFAVVATPTITSVNPSQASQGQTLSATITGTNLLGVTNVGFGSGLTVNSFTVDNSTQITASIAVSGAATIGTRDVTVTNAAGTGTLTSSFTVNQAPPVVSSVNPSQGVQGQTLGVTISGSNFTGASAVSFGADITTDNFTVDSGTQITANITIAGSAATGLRSVSVTTPGGTGIRTNGFTVLAMPTISSVNPNQASQGQSVSVTITGSNLSGVTAVGFGSGITVNSFTVDNSTQIRASVAVSISATIGTRDISVTKSGSIATLTSGFTVNQAPPTASSVYPNQGLQGQTIDVTIWGNYFTDITSVDFGQDITTNSFSAESATVARANITIGGSATPGLRVVWLTTPGGTAPLNGFTVTAATTPTVPNISSVSPSQALQGQTLSVTITGTNLLGVTTVSFGSGITVNNFTLDSANQITASIAVNGSATIGTRDVSVAKAAETATLTSGFTVAAMPAITSVSPNQVVQGQTLSVTITGTNLLGVTTVSFGSGITVNDFTVNSPTEIVANITIAADATIGTSDVSVSTPTSVGGMASGLAVAAAPQAKAGSTAVPLYYWLLAPGAAAAGLLVLGLVIRHKKKQTSS